MPILRLLKSDYLQCQRQSQRSTGRVIAGVISSPLRVASGGRSGQLEYQSIDSIAIVFTCIPIDRVKHIQCFAFAPKHGNGRCEIDVDHGRCQFHNNINNR